jgi:hypothetical protein
MTYTVFDQTAPEPTQGGAEVLTSTRENLIAVRDAIIADGFFPGWDMETQDSDGSAPPTTPEQPDQVVFFKDSELIKLSLTWGTAGGEEGNVTQIVAEYSADAGALFEPMGATGYPNGTLTISYDANGVPLSHTWS